MPSAILCCMFAVVWLATIASDRVCATSASTPLLNAVCQDVTTLVSQTPLKLDGIQGLFSDLLTPSAVQALCNGASGSTSSATSFAVSNIPKGPFSPLTVAAVASVVLSFLPSSMSIVSIQQQASILASASPVNAFTTTTTPAGSAVPSVFMYDFTLILQAEVTVSGSVAFNEFPNSQVQTIQPVSSQVFDITAMLTATSVPLGYASYVPLAWQARLETPFSKSVKYYNNNPYYTFTGYGNDGFIDMLVNDPDLTDGVPPAILIQAIQLDLVDSTFQASLVSHAQAVLQESANLNTYMTSSSAAPAALKSKLRGGVPAYRNFFPLTPAALQSSIASTIPSVTTVQPFQDVTKRTVAMSGYLWVNQTGKDPLAAAITAAAVPKSSPLQSVYNGVYISLWSWISPSAASTAMTGTMEKIADEIGKGDRCLHSQAALFSQSVAGSLAASLYVDSSVTHVLGASGYTHAIAGCLPTTASASPTTTPTTTTPITPTTTTSTATTTGNTVVVSSQPFGAIGMALHTYRPIGAGLPTGLMQNDGTAATKRARVSAFKVAPLTSSGFVWAYIPAPISASSASLAWTTGRTDLFAASGAGGGGAVVADPIISSSDGTALMQFVSGQIYTWLSAVQGLNSASLLQQKVFSDLNPAATTPLSAAAAAVTTYFSNVNANCQWALEPFASSFSTACPKATVAGLLYSAASQIPALSVTTAASAAGATSGTASVASQSSGHRIARSSSNTASPTTSATTTTTTPAVTKTTPVPTLAPVPVPPSATGFLLTVDYSVSGGMSQLFPSGTTPPPDAAMVAALQQQVNSVLPTGTVVNIAPPAVQSATFSSTLHAQFKLNFKVAASTSSSSTSSTTTTPTTTTTTSTTTTHAAPGSTTTTLPISVSTSIPDIGTVVLGELVSANARLVATADVTADLTASYPCAKLHYDYVKNAATLRRCAQATTSSSSSSSSSSNSLPVSVLTAIVTCSSGSNVNGASVSFTQNQATPTQYVAETVLVYSQPCSAQLTVAVDTGSLIVSQGQLQNMQLSVTMQTPNATVSFSSSTTSPSAALAGSPMCACTAATSIQCVCSIPLLLGVTTSTFTLSALTGYVASGTAYSPNYSGSALVQLSVMCPPGFGALTGINNVCRLCSQDYFNAVASINPCQLCPEEQTSVQSLGSTSCVSYYPYYYSAPAATTTSNPNQPSTTPDPYAGEYDYPGDPYFEYSYYYEQY